MDLALVSDGVVDLRPLRESDAAAHWAGCDQLIVDRLSGGQQPSLQQTAVWARRQGQAWDTGAAVVDLAVADHATGELAGCVGIQRAMDYLAPDEVNITYAIYPQWRGKGFASRAVVLAEELCLQGFPAAQFVIRVAPWNRESIAVAERTRHRFSHTTSDEHGELLWYRRRPAEPPKSHEIKRPRTRSHLPR